MHMGVLLLKATMCASSVVAAEQPPYMLLDKWVRTGWLQCLKGETSHLLCVK